MPGSAPLHPSADALVRALGLGPGREGAVVLLRSLATSSEGDLQALLDRVSRNAAADLLRALLTELGAILILKALEAEVPYGR